MHSKSGFTHSEANLYSNEIVNHLDADLVKWGNFLERIPEPGNDNEPQSVAIVCTIDVCQKGSF